MSTYKITYLTNDSYSNKGEHYIDNVISEVDAVECMIYKYNLGDDVRILNIDFISD